MEKRSFCSNHKVFVAHIVSFSKNLLRLKISLGGLDLSRHGLD
jgi:hypothetical protein